ncbi:Fur family transcriptional regulator [Ilumatobacter sp.]|uniref:Fur family transcriptional regulator n=1 Tax=Ilumatobacter sp. TaxID=1967498 RepID=UPI003750BE2B
MITQSESTAILRDVKGAEGPLDADEITASGALDRLITARLARHDLRYTTRRRQLVAVLLRTDRPVTLGELLDLAAGTPQSSAYRNLSLLEEAGVVRRLVHAGVDAHFELAEDLIGHHHHLICGSCGVVEDFTLPAEIERALRRAFDSITEDTRFEAFRHAVDVYGRCSTCPA